QEMPSAWRSIGNAYRVPHRRKNAERVGRPARPSCSELIAFLPSSRGSLMPVVNTNVAHWLRPAPVPARGHSRQDRHFAVTTKLPDPRPPALVRPVIGVGVFEDVDLPGMHGDAGWRPGTLGFQQRLDLAVRRDLHHAPTAGDGSIHRSPQTIGD